MIMFAVSSVPTWRSSLAASAAAGAFGLALLAAASYAKTVPAAEADAIRPFHVDVPETALVDLRRRIAATRWPDKETVTDRSQGVQLARIQELVRYWGTNYDWRKAEAKLNALPQFVTNIDGLDIHFIHVRSRHPNAMPLIMTHGWPGSVRSPIPRPMADVRRTPSISLSPRCPVMAFRASRRKPAGVPTASRVPGMC
jgi:Epoxide hydrolase N terminus